MKPDDQVCYCYHVSLRKLTNFAVREQLKRPSQMSNCLGAGTGCGWCIPILKKIFDAAQQGLVDQAAAESQSAALNAAGLPENAEQYAEARQAYLRTDEKNTF